ncbi:hypothetical protein Q5752_000322 [Cryptotrichosporon argae]
MVTGDYWTAGFSAAGLLTVRAMAYLGGGNTIRRAEDGPSVSEHVGHSDGCEKGTPGLEKADKEVSA